MTITFIIATILWQKPYTTSRIAWVKYQTWAYNYHHMNNLIYFEQQNICSGHLPWATIGVGVTIEPLEEDDKLAERCVLLVKEYGVLDFLST